MIPQELLLWFTRNISPQYWWKRQRDLFKV